jgi:predicted nucleic acid-binding protein
MILIDSTVLIDYLRTGDAKLLTSMQTHGAAVCGVMRAEVLTGARGPKHRRDLIQFLDGFQQVTFPASLWDQVGDNLASLRAAGITVPFADAIIATLGIVLDVEIWARDRHFNDMQKALPALKLFQEPP